MSDRAIQALRKWLDEHGKTQAWLAEKLGVSRAQVTQWLIGYRTPIKHANAIEDLTGVPVRTWRDK